MHLLDRHAGLRRIAATGFLTSAVSYGGFWLLDALRPGFVSRYLSVHVFLLMALLFGALWMRAGAHGATRPLYARLCAVPLSLFAAVLVWNLGEGFDDARVAAALLAAGVPIALSELLME